MLCEKATLNTSTWFSFFFFYFFRFFEALTHPVRCVTAVQQSGTPSEELLFLPKQSCQNIGPDERPGQLIILLSFLITTQTNSLSLGLILISALVICSRQRQTADISETYQINPLCTSLRDTVPRRGMSSSPASGGFMVCSTRIECSCVFYSRRRNHRCYFYSPAQRI